MLFYPLYKKESLRFRKEKGMSYISVEHLSFSYEQETVLEDISFTVERSFYYLFYSLNSIFKNYWEILPIILFYIAFWISE